jgi:hypothetical protein
MGFLQRGLLCRNSFQFFLWVLLGIRSVTFMQLVFLKISTTSLSSSEPVEYVVNFLSSVDTQLVLSLPACNVLNMLKLGSWVIFMTGNYCSKERGTLAQVWKKGEAQVLSIPAFQCKLDLVFPV